MFENNPEVEAHRLLLNLKHNPQNLDNSMPIILDMADTFYKEASEAQAGKKVDRAIELYENFYNLQDDVLTM